MSRSDAVIISKESITTTFSYKKAYVAKFDLVKNRSSSTKGHYLQTTMTSWCPGAAYLSLIKIVLLVAYKKEIFKEILPYMGMVAILVM